MKDSISLHPEHSLKPSIAQAICPVCAKAFDTNEILLFGHNKGKEAPRNTITGWQMCPEDKKKYEEGYVALVEIDNEKSSIADGVVKPEDAYRTGTIIHIKSEAFEKLFNAKTPEKGLAFVDNYIVELLKKKANECSSDE